MPTRSRFPKSATALLIVDAINPCDFPGGAAFARRARKTASSIARLASRARRSRVPVIFVNDNLGRWRSDADGLVKFVATTPGAILIDVLRPTDKDFVILKASLSGFFQTALETMLRTGGVTTVVVTGFATDACVFLTAADAYMRDFRVVVPRDCVAALSAEDQKIGLQKLKDVLKGQSRRRRPFGSVASFRGPSHDARLSSHATSRTV